MASTFSGYWTSDSPNAGDVLTTWTPGFAGTYTICTHAYSAGVVTPADADNIGVYLNTDLVAKVPIPSMTDATTTLFVYIVADTDDTISVRVIGNAGVAAVYKGIMTGRLAIY